MTKSESPGPSRAEWMAAIALTALAVLAHIELRRHVGPLWRDEAATVNVATMPSLPELWAGLEFDSFPVLPALVLRSAGAVVGTGDATLRTLGLLVGLAVLGAAWWSVRATSRALPIFSLVLLSGSAVVIRYGDSLRGYGMGTVLILVAFGLTWTMVRETSVRSVAWALVFCLLSVQFLYQNLILVLALCCGGGSVGLVRRSWKLLGACAAIGLACVATLLPYAPIMARTREWNILLKQAVDLPEIGGELAKVVGLSGSAFVWAWPALFAAGLVVCAYRASAPASTDSEDERGRFVFLGATGLAAVLGCAIFFGALGYVTRTWYFVPAIVFLAAVLDAALGPFLTGRRALRALRLVAALLLLAVIALPAWSELQVRQSRVDRAAMKLEELASKDDLIVVEPWEYGISFMRYYRGPTPWTTLPALSDHRTHRYDLIKEAMLVPSKVDSVLDQVAATLRAGHRVWLVGRTDFPPAAEPLPRLSLPPLPDSDWHAGPYILEWSERLAHLLQEHAQVWVVAPLPPDVPVNHYEDPRLLVFAGWSD